MYHLPIDALGTLARQWSEPLAKLRAMRQLLARVTQSNCWQRGTRGGANGQTAKKSPTADTAAHLYHPTTAF
ncbi:hypothetical protein GCM10027089_14460 [Nocardia thraciensis]